MEVYPIKKKKKTRFFIERKGPPSIYVKLYCNIVDAIHFHSHIW